MTNTHRAHLALVAITLIFGLAYNIVKGLMPEILSPLQLIFIRSFGAMILFWLFQRIFVFEKVERKDLWMLAICGMLGFALNQTLFYEGLNLTTPVNASLIHVLNPIFVMIFAGLIIGEKMTWKKLTGVAFGLSGVLVLVLYGHTISFDRSHITGNILIFLNMSFYALYLVLIKPLVGKYHTMTILKWVSIFGFLFVLPFSLKPALQINLATIQAISWIAIAYIIILNTFVAYLLINFALKYVDASVVSYYSYLQPVIAAILSVSIGMEGISWQKIMAALLIFAGVYFVNREKQSGDLKKVPERK